jgi:hypothetical protein
MRTLGRFLAGFTIGAMVWMPGLAPDQRDPWFRRGKVTGAAAFVLAAAAVVLVVLL